MLPGKQNGTFKPLFQLVWVVMTAASLILCCQLILRLPTPDYLKWLIQTFLATSVLIIWTDKAKRNLTSDQPASSRQEPAKSTNLNSSASDNSSRIVRMMTEANRVIMNSGSQNELLSGFCDVMKDVGGYHHVWVGLPGENNTIKTRAAAHGDEGLAEKLRLTWDNSSIGNTPPGMTLKDHETHVFEKGKTLGAAPDWTKFLPVDEMASCVSLPLFYDSIFYGAVCLCSEQPDFLDKGEIDLLNGLTQSLGYSLTAIQQNKALAIEKWKLNERLKENTFLTQALGWSADGECDLENFFKNIAEAIPPAFQWPDRTGAQVIFGNLNFSTPLFNPNSLHCIQTRLDTNSSDQCILNISIDYAPDQTQSGNVQVILPEEETLISNLSNIIYRKIQIEQLNHETLKSKHLAEAILKLSEHSVDLTKEELFSQAAGIAEDITDSAGAFIHSVNTELGEIELIGWSQQTLKVCPIPEKRHYPVESAGIWAESFRTKQPLIINDYPGLSSSKKKGLPRNHFQLNRLISVPIIEGKSVRLILGVANKKEDYNENEARRLMALGALVWKTFSLKQKQEEIVSAEKVFKETFEKTSVGIANADLNGNFIRVNQSFCQMLGYNEDELLRLSFADVTSKEDAEKENLLFSRALNGQSDSYHFVKKYIKKDGNYFWANLDVNIFRDQNGAAKYFIGVAQDVDELVNSKNSLEENHHMLNLAQSIAKIGYWKWDSKKNLMTWSREALLIVGRPHSISLSLDELINDVVHHDDADKLRKLQQKAVEEFQAYNITYRIITHENKFSPEEIRYISATGEPQFDAAGSPTGYIGIIQDITDQIKNQQFVVESQNQFKTVFNNVADAIYIADLNGNLLEVNDEACESLNTERSSLLKLNVKDVDPAFTETDDLQNQWDFSIKTKKSIQYQGHHRKSSGELFPVEVRIKATHFKGQKALIGTARDLTEIIKRDELLHIQNEALEAAENAIFITDSAGIIIWVNGSFTRVTGFFKEEVTGKKPNILNSGQHGKEYFKALWQTILQGKVWRGELTNKRKNGEEFDAMLTIAPVMNDRGDITHFVAIQQDITHVKQLEDQFQRSQRMETIGLLAGGIAHDLNNVLAPILMAAPILKEMDELPDEANELIDTIEACVNRGSDIIRQILTFSRGFKGERTPVQVRYIIKDVVNMATETFPRNIRLELHIEPDLPHVAADPTQLHQVLLNLAVNARDSMTETGGSLIISAEQKNISETRRFLNMIIGPGDYVLIAVKDTGIGISKEHIEQIFEPFFTTKEFGKGTGLGLSSALGIIKSHHGLITVDSKLGEGTTFEVFLPTCEAPDDTANEVPHLDYELKKEMVLIVDDEDNIRRTIKFILEKQGIPSIEAPNGAEALDLYKKNADDIKTIITDRMMPEMNGEDLAIQLRALNPAVNIIGMSGVLDDTAAEGDSNTTLDSKLHIFDTYLLKPFSKEALLSAIGISQIASSAEDKDY